MNARAGTRDEALIRRPETKSFILTSEFWVAAAAGAAVFVAGYALDDIARTTAWRYGTWIAIAYIISRGIAKAGSQRAYQPEPVVDRRGEGFWADGDRDDDDGEGRRAYRDGGDGRAVASVPQPPRREGESVQPDTDAP
jgi:hypothetical protein